MGMTIKTANEIRIMEKAGKLAAEALAYTGKHVRKGVTTLELDQIAEDFIRSRGAVAACMGYRGYPRSICTSVNEIVCHGVPDGRILEEQDIINIDVTVIVDGFHGDTSAMFFVGNPTARALKLVDCAHQAMQRGIEVVQAGAFTGDIGFAVNKYVTRHGFHAFEGIGGHGIGRGFHEDPYVPSFGKKGRGDPLLKWGCITVEPIVNETANPLRETPISGSEITVFSTTDGTWSAQYEHTVLITDGKAQILTQN